MTDRRTDLEVWAAEQAVQLRPMTDDEATEAGLLAARIDAESAARQAAPIDPVLA